MIRSNVKPVSPLARLPVGPFNRFTGQPANRPTGQPANRLNGHGQALLEFAISLIGIVMFVYVLLKVWVWLNTMIVGRQASFQQTRVVAGSSDPGTPAPYQRPPIRLVGSPGSTGGLPGSGIDLVPPCTAAEPFFAKAASLFDKGQQLLNESSAKAAEAGQLGKKLQELTAQIRLVCKKKKCKVVGPFAEIDQTQAALNQTAAEAQSLMDQAQAKIDEANAQLQLGDAACE